MARRRRRRNKHDLKLTIPPDTMYSATGVLLIVLGFLVMVSFAGQGALLAPLSGWLSTRFGLAMLFFPFLLMLTVLVLGRTGVWGAELYRVLATLISPAGTYLLFVAMAIVGFLVMTQWSVGELLQTLGQLRKQTDEEGQPNLFSPP